MHVKNVETNLGDVVLKWDDAGNGIIDQDAITAFEWGYCHNLAGALANATGWPIIGIGRGWYEDEPSHFIVYSPFTKDFMDIQGIGARSRWHDLWKERAEVWTTDQMGPKHYRPYRPKMAEPFVKTIIKNLKPARLRHPSFDITQLPLHIGA